jgi:NAD(P)-dependent dehydrogenase (short-subunit alcohol dehydrogenase family)
MPVDRESTNDGTADAGPTTTDLARCIGVLRAIEADRSILARMSREDRRDLLMLAGLVAKPERHDLVRMAKAMRRADRAAARERDRALIEQTGLRVQRRSEVYQPLWLPPPTAEEAAPAPAAGPMPGATPMPTAAPALKRALNCYVCKRDYATPHRYYDSMCPACGEFNYAKRSQTADLRGHYALVTGARVKIGYQAALKLLRAGAQVIVTTRFPVDAAARYALEPDFADFRDRLQVFGLDLRHTPSVEVFARALAGRLPRLDYLLNNACQTVRRPAGFFRHLLERESQPFDALPDAWQSLLAAHGELCRSVAATPLALAGAAADAATLLPATGPAEAPLAPRGQSALEGLVHSAALSQRRYLDEDFRDGESLFPDGRYDEDLQQVDLREVNSWRLRLHEVQTAELLEVQLINAIAPYTLNARLRPLMARTPGRHKHIVNVSAMEGQFYRTTKTDRHPHTNMAKAALNMMTRTSAPDYLRDGIHMNAVDTGWVTDEDPAVHAARKAELGFAPPLDIIDGAARIVDPIFEGHRTGQHPWGQFLKDYRPAPW